MNAISLPLDSSAPLFLLYSISLSSYGALVVSMDRLNIFGIRAVNTEQNRAITHNNFIIVAGIELGFVEFDRIVCFEMVNILRIHSSEQ